MLCSQYAPLSILRHLTLNLIKALLILFQLRLFSLLLSTVLWQAVSPEFGLSLRVFRFSKFLIHSLALSHSLLLRISLFPVRMLSGYRSIALLQR